MSQQSSADTMIFTEDERVACLKVLRQLTAHPERLFDKGNAEFASLAEVRAEANRLIESVKQTVRIRRGQPPQGKTSKSQIPPKRSSSPPPNNCPWVSAVGQRENPHSSETHSPSSSGCYICAAKIPPVDQAYAQLCPACGRFNWQKRQQTADLSGLCAVVTGGRIRIGYQIGLKLLRAGATVHITTRFPYSAADRYCQEADFSRWSGRLHIHGLDLRDANGILRFAQQVLASGSLEILVNNAAQTIRRPESFYHHLIATEEQGERSLPGGAGQLVVSPNERLRQQALEPATWPDAISLNGLDPLHHTSWLSQQMTQGEGVPGESSRQIFLNEENEPLDLRRETSWTQTLAAVRPLEFWEVYAINTFAPFLLMQCLLPAMKRASSPRRFVVNVSAREGQFHAKKGGAHPHTNMAKAALNMLTRTTAPDLSKVGIYVNSVDPGWVSSQRPFDPEATRQAIPPLSAQDGAARVLDPVFTGLTRAETPTFGQLFKDYRAVSW